MVCLSFELSLPIDRHYVRASKPLLVQLMDLLQIAQLDVFLLGPSSFFYSLKTLGRTRPKVDVFMDPRSLEKRVELVVHLQVELVLHVVHLVPIFHEFCEYFLISHHTSL